MTLVPASLRLSAFPAAVAALFFLPDGRAETRYRPVDFSRLLGLPAEVPAGGIALNNRGQVLGSFVDDPRNFDQRALFLYDNGKVTVLGRMGGWSAQAIALSDAGHILGRRLFADGRSEGFVLHEGRLAILPAGARPAAINAGGTVALIIEDASLVTRGYLYRPGELVEVGSFGGFFTRILGLNGRGDVVGDAAYPDFTLTHAFVSRAGVIRDLGAWDGWLSVANAINDAGTIVDWSTLRRDERDALDFQDGAITHAFVFQDGVMRDLGVLSEGFKSWAYSINNRGQIVGRSERTRIQTPRGGVVGGGYTAVLWEGAHLRNLNRLIDWPEPRELGLSEPRAINDRGEILADGFLLQPHEGERGRLVNFSVRATVAPRPAILGFGLSGEKREVLVRGVGRGLASFGIADGIGRPAIALRGTGVAVDAIGEQNGGSAIAAARLGAFPLRAGERDAAASAWLGSGVFTLTLASTGGERGVALAEIYDSSRDAGQGWNNASALVELQAGGTATAGFVLAGTGAKNVLVRAVGPGLREFGIDRPVRNPELRLLDAQGGLLASNTGWASYSSAPGPNANLELDFKDAGAFPLSPTGRDSALAMTLPAGAYGIEVRDAGAATGLVLIELYELP